MIGRLNRRVKNLPSQEVVKRLFDYDAQSGSLVWRAREPSYYDQEPAHGGGWSNELRARRWNKTYAGKSVGCPTAQGYLKVGYKGRHFLVHRIIWVWVNGDIPPGFEIDHINHMVDDNRIVNLRACPPMENCHNVRLGRNNSSGTPGVRWDRDRKRWFAGITVAGRPMSLGYHASKGCAVKARKQAEAKYGFHANHGLPSARSTASC